MNRCLMMGIVRATFCGVSTLAYARPPTVMNSPGYDARLQESRKALSGTTTTPEQVTPQVTTPKKSKKKQPN